MSRRDTLLSIIIVCYNSQETISKCLNSILDQRIQDLELVIVDGNSLDNTVQIIKYFEEPFSNSNIRYKWISEQDEGIYDAMNKGIELASGRYVFFMGSDDLLITNSLKKLVKRIDGLDNKRCLIALPVIISDKNNKTHKAFPKVNNSLSIIHHQGALFRRDMLNGDFTYSKDFKVHSDFQLISRYSKKYGVQFIDVPICKFNKGGTSTSGKNTIVSLKELYKIYTINGGNIFSLDFLKLMLRPIYYYFTSWKQKCI